MVPEAFVEVPLVGLKVYVDTAIAAPGPVSVVLDALIVNGVLSAAVIENVPAAGLPPVPRAPVTTPPVLKTILSAAVEDIIVPKFIVVPAVIVMPTLSITTVA
jgi:hypothetical protein